MIEKVENAKKDRKFLVYPSIIDCLAKYIGRFLCSEVGHKFITKKREDYPYINEEDKGILEDVTYCKECFAYQKSGSL